MKTALIIGSIFFLGSYLLSSNVRGIRNKNLLNIKYHPANNWVGQLGRDEKDFIIFEHPIYSLRAGFKLLKSYKNRDVVSIFQIVRRFAPSSENDTEAYIKFVSKKTGIPATRKLKESQWPKVIQAMSRMEVGEEPNLALVLDAQKLAFS